MNRRKESKALTAMAKHLKTTKNKIFSIYYLDGDKENISINNLLHVSSQEKTYLNTRAPLIIHSFINQEHRVLNNRLWHRFEKVVWFARFPALKSLDSDNVPYAKKYEISISNGTDPKIQRVQGLCQH